MYDKPRKSREYIYPAHMSSKAIRYMIDMVDDDVDLKRLQYELKIRQGLGE